MIHMREFFVLLQNNMALAYNTDINNSSYLIE